MGPLVLQARLARLDGARGARVGAVRVTRSAAAGHGTEIGHRMHGPEVGATRLNARIRRLVAQGISLIGTALVAAGLGVFFLL